LAASQGLIDDAGLTARWAAGGAFHFCRFCGLGLVTEREAVSD
jgi:hypothetical protein